MTTQRRPLPPADAPGAAPWGSGPGVGGAGSSRHRGPGTMRGGCLPEGWEPQRLRDDELTAGQVVEAAGEEHPGKGALGACPVRCASLDGAFERECHSLASGAGRSRRREHPGQDGDLYRPRQDRRGPRRVAPSSASRTRTAASATLGFFPAQVRRSPQSTEGRRSILRHLRHRAGWVSPAGGAAALVEVRAVGATGPARPQRASSCDYSPAGGMTTRPGTLGGESPGQRGHPWLPGTSATGGCSCPSV